MQTTQVEKEVFIQRFTRVREQTAALCAPLHPEDHVPQAAEFVSPPKWHLAHTTWFFEEMILKRYGRNYREFNPHFGFLFNSYYQQVGERAVRGQRGLITRPLVSEVMEYRDHVNRAMEHLMASDIGEEVCAVVELGIAHEEQHQELLLTDLKYTLSMNPTYPVYLEGASRLEESSDNLSWISMDEGLYPIGSTGEGFSFDNERGHHQVYLPSFEIADHLVTNGDYLEFMHEGGYLRPEYWLDEGWDWKEKAGVNQPLYWEKKEGRWHQFTLGGLLPLNPLAMLGHISYYEASAFAQWKGMRLPTEFEWEAASSKLDWGKRWEWTASAYQAYPGFSIAEGALGEYNGKFMVNQLVLRGGSVATAKGHTRHTYRNFFHPNLAWQYTGIRLAR